MTLPTTLTPEARDALTALLGVARPILEGGRPATAEELAALSQSVGVLNAHLVGAVAKEESTFTGGITNQGTIQATGAAAAALAVEHSADGTEKR